MSSLSKTTKSRISARILTGEGIIVGQEAGAVLGAEVVKEIVMAWGHLLKERVG